MDTLSYLIGKKSGSGPSGTIIDSLSITNNGHYVAPAGHAYNPVSVNVEGGAVSVPKKDVNFFDYDGTVLYSYTKEEFMTLDALPANPAHASLTARGWNWSLADAKT